MSNGPFRLSFAALTAAVTALVLASTALAADPSPHPVGDSDLNPVSKKFEETSPHPTAKTVQHWVGHTTNPVNGVTYTYSIVGADPRSGRSAGVGVDVVPVNLTIAGRSFSGSDSVAAVLASPLFREGDYSTTAAATNASGASGPGGSLSPRNEDVQMLDAIMRSEFNKVGTGYHLVLQRPEVRAPVSLEVPAADGTTLASPVGIVYGDVDVSWFQPQIEGLTTKLRYLKPDRLVIFLTRDVVLFSDHVPTHCCVLGAHGSTDTTAAPNDEGDRGGRQRVQTFVWSSWLTAGFFNPRKQWARQDIHGLSHEITEWANDPFGTNAVQPWFSPIAPQYGCSNLLETGDPVLGIGFSLGKNAFDQNAFSDGTYHPEDEAFLPWFMRTSPNTVSQGGRYTFLGDLNPFAFFHKPPAAC